MEPWQGFDINWLFAEAGDFYLGQILAALNPNTSSDFEVIPPHFTTGMDNPFIKEAILISYPNITKLSGLQNIKGLLLRCLASVVHHSHKLIKIINKHHTGYLFSQISILHSPGLLNHLKPLVTILPSSKNQCTNWYPTPCQDDDPTVRYVETSK
jgi:hypothetical protein